jgi:VTC domain
VLKESIHNIISTYRTFSLTDLDAANLLERKDFKYVIHLNDFNEALEKIKSEYKVLSVNNLVYTDYETHYYDTKEFRFYFQHHNGQANRYKIRLRTYIQSKISFYEEKFKNNKNWTSKYRQKIAGLDADIKNYTAHTELPDLEKKLLVYYTRITMLSNDNTEKLTFDLNLRYENTDGEQVCYDDFCIAEVKSKSHHPFVFRKVIKAMGYSTMGLSKYCFGIINLYKHLKSNNFKNLNIYINKLRKNELVTE